MGGKRLEISADFVAHIAGSRRAVSSNYAQINETVLHEMASGIVGDHSMWNSLSRKLVSGDA